MYKCKIIKCYKSTKISKIKEHSKFTSYNDLYILLLKRVFVSLCKAILFIGTKIFIASQFLNIEIISFADKSQYSY